MEKYALEAKPIITTVLHCATSCIALGIPVILLQEDEAHEDRFSALKGILKPYILKDLKNNQVDFNPKILDIENLKEMMIKNLKLTLKNICLATTKMKKKN